MGPVLGPNARTNRTRDTRVAERRLPAPEDERPCEGESARHQTHLSTVARHPPGESPHHPRCTQPPQGMQTKEAMLGSHTRTPAPTARG